MQSLRSLKDNRIVRSAFLLILAALAAVSVLQGAKNALEFSQDLQWDAAKALSLGLDPYELSSHPEEAANIPELAGFYKMFTDRGLSQNMEANQFPSLLVLLYPLTALPAESAKTVWLVCNLVFTAGIVFLLKKTFFEGTGAYEYAVITLIMLAGTPYRNQLGVGQHTLFAFCFFMLAVYIDRKQLFHPAVNTVMTALCLFVSYFKYTLTGPLALYFLYKKKYKELFLSVAGHVILTEVCAIKLGKSFMYMLTAPLGVAAKLESQGGLDLGVLLKSPWSYVVAAVIAALLVGIAIKLPEGADNILFSLLILWSLILVYHRTYDFWPVSAVWAMFAANEMTRAGKGQKTAAAVSYWVVVAALYFGLRVFNESTVSMIITGVMYYAFTIGVTINCIKGIKNEQ